MRHTTWRNRNIVRNLSCTTLLVVFGPSLFAQPARPPEGSRSRPEVFDPGHTLVAALPIDKTTITPATPNAVQTLISALEAENRFADGKVVPIVIELCNVAVDLTGKSLVIGSDRSLVAGPGCERGPRNPGSRIFVRDTRGSDKPLFSLRGDNILFAGFRLEGPTNAIGAGSSVREMAIVVSPFESADPIRNIEISDLEIFHWSGAAVYIGDNTVQAERGRLFNTNVGAVRVKNNFIHHNRHGDGYGYGVEVTGGAYALIERNVFDENRHAIAGGSSDHKKDFTGYTVRDNLILSGGGQHCSERWWFGIVGWHFNCWQTHQIDMHGDESTTFGGDWCCGRAGETLIIERNTVLYTAGLAVKIRGRPLDKGVLDGNVFKHGSRGSAIQQNEGPSSGKALDIRPNNVFGVDPLTSTPTCDFVGDGRPERFMSTGATWWAESSVTGQWRYLNTRPERLNVLVLGDIDGDHVCDVALAPPQPTMLPRKYSKSGTGPWVDVLQVVNH